MRATRDVIVGLLAGILVFCGGWEIGKALRSEVQAWRDGQEPVHRPPWQRMNRQRLDQC